MMNCEARSLITTQGAFVLALVIRGMIEASATRKLSMPYTAGPRQPPLEVVRMSGKRRKYTPEFREQAARLVIETGRPVAHVAAEIGVGEQVLGRWVRLAKESAAAGDTGAVLDADERAELERLRRENAELRLDRAFLKKAAAFFVSEQNR